MSERRRGWLDGCKGSDFLREITAFFCFILCPGQRITLSRLKLSIVGRKGQLYFFALWRILSRWLWLAQCIHD